MRVLGGVVTYNPDIERFKSNIYSLMKQVDYLYLFDNGSKNFNEIRQVVSEFSEKIYIWCCPKCGNS